MRRPQSRIAAGRRGAIPMWLGRWGSRGAWYGLGDPVSLARQDSSSGATNDPQKPCKWRRAPGAPALNSSCLRRCWTARRRYLQ
jgi:hypothetical protein